jgi:hypothetical protein
LHIDPYKTEIMLEEHDEEDCLIHIILAYWIWFTCFSLPVRQKSCHECGLLWNQGGYTVDNCHCPAMFLQTSSARVSHQPTAVVIDMSQVPESIPMTHFTHPHHAPLLYSKPYAPCHLSAVCSAGTSSALDLQKLFPGPQFAPTCDVSPKTFCIYTKLIKLTGFPLYKVCSCLTASFNDPPKPINTY